MGRFATAPVFQDVRLAYRPRAFQLIVGLLFFTSAAVGFGWWSADGQGLIVNGIEFGPTGATIFKLVFAAASAGMSIFAALFLLPQSLRRDRHIRLSDKAIDVPVWHGWSDASIHILASDITAVTASRYGKATFLRLHHPAGVARINSTHFLLHEDVDVILHWIAERRPELLGA